MKQVIGNWKLGDRVRGKVTEQLPSGELIISFQGDLLRVGNESLRVFKVGEEVSLELIQISPIRFKIATPIKRNRMPGRFDVSI